MKYPLLLASAIIMLSLPLAAQQPTYQDRISSSVKQTPDSEERLNQWYRDAKYGAFIHFGIYSMLGGVLGDEVPDAHYSEWIRHTLEISPEKYHEISAHFNPTEFDADEWVTLFKNAGMKYVVITAKHHDGFALFDSDVSNYNVVDYTPFKRDIIKELSEASHRQGLKFGVYYSHAKDWDEPNATDLRPHKTHALHPALPDDFTPNLDHYLHHKSLPQVEELVKNYEIDLVWFDTPHGMTPERAKLFSELVWKYRPDALINSRILLRAAHTVTQESLNYFDFVSLKDKEVPPVPPKAGALYVESPDSVSTSYGYHKFGKYHTEKELVERMVHTVCNGGNYLLNNGPMGNGKIPEDAVRLYKAVGEWLDVNGESIYDTRPNPLGKRPEWGDVCTSKDGNTLYLHVLNAPENGIISIDGLTEKAKESRFLANGKKAKCDQENGTLSITLPEQPLDPYNTVIKVSF